VAAGTTLEGEDLGVGADSAVGIGSPEGGNIVVGIRAPEGGYAMYRLAMPHTTQMHASTCDRSREMAQPTLLSILIPPMPN
jgi:hypothetical protein